MTLFLASVNQMAFLFFLIIVGYILLRIGILDGDACKILSKIENNVFIPALVLGTFMKNLTVDNINIAGKYLLYGSVVIAVNVPVAIFCANLCAKDDYIRKIYTYGLAFSNFGFMGNAVVSTLFPDLFMNYLVFVLPFWFVIYLWGVPSLLMPSKPEGTSLKSGLLQMVNPMFIAVLVGAVIGLTKLPVPNFLQSAISTLGDCMSPVAMLLTGMTIAKTQLSKMFKRISVYVVSIIRLLIIPILAIVVLKLLNVPQPLALCTVCSLAMPLGLNTIVVPSAYGSDTTIAASMALISHLLSCITIPIVFLLF